MPTLTLIRKAVCLLAGISLAISVHGQNASAVALGEELKAQYKLAKLGTGSVITEGGAVLVIQKEGMVGIAPASAAMCPATYSEGAVRAPNADNDARCGKDARKLKTGEKVYVVKIEMDSQKDRVSLLIVGCGSCNATPQPEAYKSSIVFQYPRGYLAGADAGQVEDVIGQVLAPESGAGNEAQAASGVPGSPAGLTNADVVRLVQAKLPDTVVLAKIKSSACDFDTSADALIKLKQAGVSDAILQAIVEASTPSNSSGTADATPDATPHKDSDATPACGNYDACLKMAQSLFESSQWDRSLVRFQEATQIDASKGDAWAGIGNADFQMGQYDDALLMWDKAVQLGTTLVWSACHAKALCGDTGSFQLSLKEISFVSKKGEKELSAAPSDITSEGAVLVHTNPPAYYLQIHSGGKNYRFYYLPRAVRCSLGFACPEPGATQQKVLGDYLHDRIARIAAGDFGSTSSK